MMNNSLFVDIDHFQKAKKGQNSYGDAVAKKYIREENRKIAVFSDGMGSGIKANVLASLTASMAVNFIAEHKDISKASELIMNILPECSERRVSYSTFVIFDHRTEGGAHLIVYDSPLPVITRGESLYDAKWTYTELTGEKHKGKRIYQTSFVPRTGDRIVAFTDGVSQSGLGFKGEWGRDGAESYVLSTLKENLGISAASLCEKLVNKAEVNDEFTLKDDASVLTVHFRNPRKIILCTGPPSSKQKDFAFAKEFRDFKGKRIIAGGTTSEIIARELELKFKDRMYSLDDGLPPISILENVELVTEGVMTLSKAERLLREGKLDPVKDGAAERMVKMIQNADSIKFLVGASSNEYHYDLQYKMRLQIVKDMIEILENDYLKKTLTVLY